VLQVITGVIASSIRIIYITVPFSLASLFVWLLLSCLSGSGYLTENSATANLMLRVTGTHKPLHHGKVETPLEELLSIHFVTVLFCFVYITILHEILPVYSVFFYTLHK